MDDEDTLLPRKLQAALEQALERKNELISQDSDSDSDDGETRLLRHAALAPGSLCAGSGPLGAGTLFLCTRPFWLMRFQLQHLGLTQAWNSLAPPPVWFRELWLD